MYRNTPFRSKALFLSLFFVAELLGLVGFSMRADAQALQISDPVNNFDDGPDCWLWECTAREAATYASDRIEKRYHIDPYSTRDAAEGQNVATKKDAAPQVHLLFSPNDPKPGQEVTAHAFPLFFSTATEDMYYTWYLKRRGCDLGGDATEECDLDGNGMITVNDWKIEAMRIHAKNNYVKELSDDNADNEGNEDGYKATYGGDRQVNNTQCGPDNDRHCCYIHDFDDGDYNVVEYELTSCKHLFPTPGPGRNFTTGDGQFGANEEEFWGTNPKDPDTAQNGKKDEANVVGLGATDFTWIYNTGDMLGVVVEGVSLNPTKHSNTSRMIQWAFLKNKCKPENTGYYEKTIHTYPVIIPQATMDLNDCLKDNIVDPTEGGQAGNMDLSLASEPEHPVAKIADAAMTDDAEGTDVTGTASDPQSGNLQSAKGDILTVHAISNESPNADTVIWYQWAVLVSQNGQFNPRFDDPSKWVDITDQLVEKRLVSQTEGNGANDLQVNLNLDSSFSQYFPNGVGYFYFVGTAKENYQENVGRGARAGLVVMVRLSDYQISSAQVDTVDGSDGISQVKYQAGSEFCTSENSQSACRIVKNQIVALKAPPIPKGEDGEPLYDDFLWTVNGKPIICNTRISPDCNDTQQNEYNFFPILGNVGERYQVTLTMTNKKSGNNIAVTKDFFIVDPGVTIEPNDDSVWKKMLGQYKDVDGKTIDDYSDSILETGNGGTASLKAVYTADNIKEYSQLVWMLNDVVQTQAEGASQEELTFDVILDIGNTYVATVRGIYRQPQEIRKALRDLWGVSPFESGEDYFEARSQIDVVDSGEDEIVGFLQGPKKYFASLVAYIPDTVLFVLRLAFTLTVALFVVGMAGSFLPSATYERRP